MTLAALLLILKPLGTAVGGVLATLLVQAFTSPRAIKKMVILLARTYVKKTKSEEDDKVLAILEEAWGELPAPPTPPAE